MDTDKKSSSTNPDAANERPRQSWGWLRDRMPAVARLIADRRREVGSDWVDECWRHGVLERQPGWFYASEGALAVGTLWDNPVVLDVAMARITDTQSMVILRPKEEAAGA